MYFVFIYKIHLVSDILPSDILTIILDISDFTK